MSDPMSWFRYRGVLREPDIGGAHNAGALTGAYGSMCLFIIQAPAPFDLDEYEPPSSDRDDVHFAAGAAPAFVQDPVAIPTADLPGNVPGARRGRPIRVGDRRMRSWSIFTAQLQAKVVNARLGNRQPLGHDLGRIAQAHYP